MSIEYRLTKKDEVAECARIEQACFPPEEAASVQEIMRRYEVFPECFWVAADDSGKLVGFLDGCVYDRPALPDELYHNAAFHCPEGEWQTVFGLNVLPAFRHQKIATHLMEQLIKDSKERGRKGVVLTCKDIMRPFYESLGFKWQGISSSTHGGAKWNDMLLVFASEDEKA